MILITGSSGFIGMNLIESLNQQGITDIITVDDLPIRDDSLRTSTHFTIDEALQNIKWDSVEKIFHQGAISSTTERDWTKLNHYNVDFSCRLIDIAVSHDIPISYASSAGMYYESFNELATLRPSSLYGMSKAIVDAYALDKMRTNRHAKIQGLRYFNVCGGREEHKLTQASPMTQFIRQARETGRISIFAKSERCLRDFIAVDDVVDVIQRVMKSDFSGIVNVGTGKARSFKYVAEVVAARTDAKIEEIAFPDSLVPQYQWYTCADTKLLTSVIGKKAFQTAEQIVDNLLRAAPDEQ